MIKGLMQIKSVSEYLSNFLVGFCHTSPYYPGLPCLPLWKSTLACLPQAAAHILKSSFLPSPVKYPISSICQSLLPNRQTNIDPSSSLAGCCWREWVIIKAQSFDSCFLLLFLLQYRFIYIHFSQAYTSHSTPPLLSAISDKIILDKSNFLMKKVIDSMFLGKSYHF